MNYNDTYQINTNHYLWKCVKGNWTGDRVDLDFICISFIKIKCMIQA